MKQMILWALTIVLAAFSVYYAVCCHFNFGNLCVWILTAASLGYTLCWKKLDPWLAHTLPGRILLGVLAAGALLFCAVLGVILFGQYGEKATGKEKSILVLGCAVQGHAPSRLLACRLDAALAQWQANPSALLVVCGGQGPEEIEAEGRVMARWLTEHGVPESSILIDDTSTSTEENFQNAAVLLAARNIRADEAAVFVTNGFHCWRAAQYAKAAGFTDCGAVPAGLPPTQIPACYLREVFAVLYYWVFRSPGRGLMGKLVGFLWTGSPLR